MNSVIHFEIPSDDKNRAKEFYAKVFGWEINESPIGDGTTYSGAITTPVDDNFMPKEPGAINGALIERDEQLKHPVITINVDSVEEALEKIRVSGGQKLTEKGEVPGMGFYAYFKDTEGNVIGLWENI